MSRSLDVLLVHPQAAAAARLADALRAAGHHVRTAQDGEQAIDRFVQQPSEVLVIELGLRGRDASATIDALRWAPGGRALRIVITDADAHDVERLDAIGRRLGAVATMAGPPDEDGLVRALRTLPADAGETRVADLAAVSQAALYSRAIGLPDHAGTRDVMAPDDDELGDAGITVQRAAPARRETQVLDDSVPPRADDDPAAVREGREVELARDVAPALVALSGDLEDTPLARVLHTLRETRATGGLVIVSAGDDDDAAMTTTGETPKKVLYLRDGLPMFVKSNLVRECLGQVLVRSGRLSAQARNESVERMREGEGRQGAILLKMGAITPAELRAALEEQLRVKLFDLFAWPRGEYRFSASLAPPPEVITLDLGLEEIVYEGIVRRVPPANAIAAVKPRQLDFVVPVPARIAPFARLDLVQEARACVAAIDGTKRLTELLSLSGRRPHVVAQLVWAMSLLDAVRFSLDPEQASKSVPPPQPGALPEDASALRVELVALVVALRAGRVAEALGGTPHATSIALEARLRPLTLPGRAPRDVRALAAEVLELLPVALGVVAPPGARQEDEDPWEDETRDDGEARARLARGSASGPGSASVPGSISIPGSVSVPGSVSGSASVPVSASGSVSASASASGSVSVPGSVSASASVPASVPASASASVPASVPASASASVPGSVPASASASVPASASIDDMLDAASTRPLPSPPPRQDLDARVHRIAEAERHFRRGERALAKDRTQTALEAFLRAVELCPDEGEFLAAAAWARHLAFPDDARERAVALTQLAEAAALAPKLDVAHLRHGLVLRAAGEEPRAREAFERALAANPACEPALRALRDA